MPQTYMRTSPGFSGLKSSFRPVSELCIASMGLQPAACRLPRHDLEQRGEFRAVRLAGERDTQRHEELGPLASRALLQHSYQRGEVRVRLIEGLNRRGEELGARR